ncbi:hypothetical protein SAMN02745127_02273 [Oceanospirillum multiglobuliferum]|uniref:Uncharacterized protein n=1 Tax=Oceanospirillum multiglobuliferum TaxID=64969 RepID=A0A1T4RB66_9GAMM|nr:hypothetical protein [Oceanospirillum multiglobuliferum]OPX55164.1 hypothetical protein BTE48_10415 [Oceanospirillum multiglobuliferum]SKA13213.1 hypothetical protein SAMN02745127_02273 [Oceanospirillum multiglobuliferum]
MSEAFPDIEIYVQDPEQSQIDQWFSELFTQISAPKRLDKRTLAYEVTTATGVQFSVNVVEKAAGKYWSIWFDSPETPWATDIDCARAAFAFFAKPIRCSVGSWEPDQPMDLWWQISNKGEGEISWPDN